jgi:hypothetical protein
VSSKSKPGGKASMSVGALRATKQDAQINYFEHLDHLHEIKDLAAKMLK